MTNCFKLKKYLKFVCFQPKYGQVNYSKNNPTTNINDNIIVINEKYKYLEPEFKIYSQKDVHYIVSLLDIQFDGCIPATFRFGQIK